MSRTRPARLPGAGPARWLWLAVGASLVVALPGVLLTAGVTDWRWLAGAALAAATGSVLVSVGVERFTWGERTATGAAGSLTVRDRLPVVRQVSDPLLLGVHPAPRTWCHEPERMPRYLARDATPTSRTGSPGPGSCSWRATRWPARPARSTRRCAPRCPATSWSPRAGPPRCRPPWRPRGSCGAARSGWATWRCSSARPG